MFINKIYPNDFNIILYAGEGSLNGENHIQSDKTPNVYMGHRTKRFFQWSGKMGERL